MNTLKKYTGKTIFAMAVALSVFGAFALPHAFAADTWNDLNLLVQSETITGVRAQLELQVINTLAKSYDFSLEYNTTAPPSVVYTATPSCDFSKTTQAFTDGTKKCVFLLTGLTPNSEYHYKLTSNVTFPNLSDSWNGNFRTLTAQQGAQNDGVCGEADISNTPGGVQGEPSGDNNPAILCAKGTPTAVTATMNPDGWKWTCKRTATQGQDANCKAKKEGSYSSVDGRCDNRTNRQSFMVKPTTLLCLSINGVGTVVETQTGWEWTCKAKPGSAGQPENCSATDSTLGGGGNGNGSASLGDGGAGTGTAVNAACGTANGKNDLSGQPSGSDLCSPGSVGSGGVTGDGSTSSPWEWVCTGVNGGRDAGPCSAQSAGTQEQGPTNLLRNPFKTLDSFPKIIAAVINNIVLPVAVPFIAVMLIYSGMLFVLAREKGAFGDLTGAKRTLKYTLIGAALVLGAFVIANAIQGTLNELLGVVQSIGAMNPFV